MKVGMWCGSLGVRSTNAAALDVATRHLTTKGIDTVRLEGFSTLPPFRSDQVNTAGTEVDAFRASIENCDSVLIAAPEYAGGLAGSVKNALDWMVGSGSFYKRVVGVLSSGTTGGPNAIEQLIRTLSWQGGLVVSVLGISNPSTKTD
jgi:chromate reductase, NAD(P)H dehydrogenase (quinone)